jgi:hypothetical protein
VKTNKEGAPVGISKNKKIKSISFNVKNEGDRAILKHISRRNFSGYVKKLILSDIERKENNLPQNEGKVRNNNNVVPTKPFIPKSN